MASRYLVALLDGRDTAAHVYPLSITQDDLAHPRSALRVVADRGDPDCPLCRTGTCTQRVGNRDGVEVVFHGARLH